jgi:hypothetical protein
MIDDLSWYRTLLNGLRHSDGFERAMQIGFPLLWALAFALHGAGFLRIDGQRGDVGVALIACGLLATIGLYGWMRAVRYARLIDDTPTSRIASAAQGYVELSGRGKPLGGRPLRAPITGQPVLWYRLDTYERQGNNQALTGSETSDDSFLLDDGSGMQCAIDPEGARMLVARPAQTFDNVGARYVLRCLLPDDPIYALGEFMTLGSIEPERDISAQIGELLADWKRDRGELLFHFDLDRNGEIDPREWALARARARREVLKTQREADAAAQVHVMRQPEDGRLYLISSVPQSSIARRYRWQAIGCMTLFLGALATAAWVYKAGA